MPVAGHWALRRARHQTMYGVRVLAPRPAGTLALPGDAAALRLHVDVETGAAMVHDPYAKILTVVARVRHPAFVLLGPADQQRWVAGWGRVYATLAQSGRIARVQVLERTMPDSGRGVSQYICHDTPPRRDIAWPPSPGHHPNQTSGEGTRRRATPIRPVRESTISAAIPEH